MLPPPPPPPLLNNNRHLPFPTPKTPPPPTALIKHETSAHTLPFSKMEGGEQRRASGGGEESRTWIGLLLPGPRMASERGERFLVRMREVVYETQFTLQY